MLPRTNRLTEPGIIRDGQQEVRIRTEVIAYLFAEDDLVANGRRQGKTVCMQLRLHIRPPTEGGHWQVKERCQRTQNRLQRNKLAERNKMILVIPVSRGVAVVAVFAERNDGVVGIVAVLLIQTRIHNPGDQRTAARAQQIVHHIQKRLLVNFQIRNGGFRPDDQLRFTHHLFSGVGVDFQRVQQLFLIPLHRLRNIALYH